MSQGGSQPAAAAAIGAEGALFETAGIDLDGQVMSKAEIERWLPHRGAMSLLDRVVWLAPDRSRCIGVKSCRSDEFWVPGHFPGVPLLPGVLMVEAAAQLMCMLYNHKDGRTRTGVFTRIADCAFRQSVTVGDDLFIMVQEQKFGSRRFQAAVQGWVAGKQAFDAQLSGIVMLDKMSGQGE
jgi:3-hydroxyacyl-[acyl-carrier-protein] dehydratase